MLKWALIAAGRNAARVSRACRTRTSSRGHSAQNSCAQRIHIKWLLIFSGCHRYDWGVWALETTHLIFAAGTSLLWGKVLVYVLLKKKWKQSFRWSFSVRPSSMLQDTRFEIIHLFLSTMFCSVSKGRRKQIMESLILIWFRTQGAIWNLYLEIFSGQTV